MLPALALLALGVAPDRDGAWVTPVPGFGVAARVLLVGGQGDRVEAPGDPGVGTPRLDLGAEPDEPGAVQGVTQPPVLSAERLQALAADVSSSLAELAGLADVPELEVLLVPRTSVGARARLE